MRQGELAQFLSRDHAKFVEQNSRRRGIAATRVIAQSRAFGRQPKGLSLMLELPERRLPVVLMLNAELAKMDTSN